jgi:hypothetical protein
MLALIVPIWVGVVLPAVPGVVGLLTAVFYLGGVNKQVKNLATSVIGLPKLAEDVAGLNSKVGSLEENVAKVPRMAEDISYLKGRLEGADIERLADGSGAITAAALTRARAKGKIAAV